LVTLNQTRRQPSFGSVLDANTRLRLGWNLVVPADPSGLARVSAGPSVLTRDSVGVTRTGECREPAAGGPNLRSSRRENYPARSVGTRGKKVRPSSQLQDLAAMSDEPS